MKATVLGEKARICMGKNKQIYSVQVKRRIRGNDICGIAGRCMMGGVKVHHAGSRYTGEADEAKYREVILRIKGILCAMQMTGWQQRCLYLLVTPAA